MKSNTLSYAEAELNILLKTVKDPIIKDFVPEILAICEKFGKSGQSGGSAPYTASALSDAIKKLCLQEPICDITGLDEEWYDVSEMMGKKSYQNGRCGGLFKDENGKCTYVDALIFKSPTGSCWSGSAKINGKTLRSKQEVKSFPFKPKTFYIDITEEEVSKDNWEFTVKSPSQLKQAYKLYNLNYE